MIIFQFQGELKVGIKSVQFYLSVIPHRNNIIDRLAPEQVSEEKYSKQRFQQIPCKKWPKKVKRLLPIGR
jgi:hypothetical protein